VGPGDLLGNCERKDSLVGLDAVPVVEGLALRDGPVGPGVVADVGISVAPSLVGPAVMDVGASGVREDGLGGTVPELPAVKPALGLAVSLVGPEVAEDGFGDKENPVGPGVWVVAGGRVTPSFVGPGVPNAGCRVAVPCVGSGTLIGVGV
jgi:hypothetical protein